MKESGRALPDAHLSDDKAVAKMGHPDWAAYLCCRTCWRAWMRVGESLRDWGRKSWRPKSAAVLVKAMSMS